MSNSVGMLFVFMHNDVSVLRTIDFNTLETIMGKSTPIYTGAEVTIFDKQYKITHIEIDYSYRNSNHKHDDDEERMDDTEGNHLGTTRVYIDSVEK